MKNLLTLKIPGNNGTSIEIIPPDNIRTDPGDFNKILSWGIGILLIGATLFALGYLLYGGTMWITSQGDKQKIESSRKMLTYAVGGLLVAFLSFFAIKFFGVALGVNLLNQTF